MCGMTDCCLLVVEIYRKQAMRCIIISYNQIFFLEKSKLCFILLYSVFVRMRFYNLYTIRSFKTHSSQAYVPSVYLTWYVRSYVPMLVCKNLSYELLLLLRSSDVTNNIHDSQK